MYVYLSVTKDIQECFEMFIVCSSVLQGCSGRFLEFFVLNKQAVSKSKSAEYIYKVFHNARDCSSIM